MSIQGTLTDLERLSTVELLIKVTCFVKKMFAISKALDLN
jgi:hypothetical protein